MARINTGRIVAGGLAAGLVMNVLDFLINGVLLGPRFAQQLANLNPALRADSPRAMAGFITLDFVIGIALAWLYAAIRPRFGPGPRTAMIAGFVAWVLLAGAFTSYWFQGMFTWKLIGAANLCGVAVILSGALVAGKLYTESEA